MTTVGSGTSPLTVLFDTAKATASETQAIQIGYITKDMQNQLTKQIAALQAPTDQVSINYSQNQIANLMTQQKTVMALGTVFGQNANTLGDMLSQITLMTSAANNGDSTGFDNALSAANTDLTNLTPAAYNGLFRPDGITALKTNGLAINSSATYDLSTGAGQTAALADLTTAQNLVNRIFGVTSSNQTVAGSQSAALTGQIGALQSLQTQAQTANAASIAQQTQTLQTNMQNALHLIELNLGSANQTANMLSAAMNPPTAVNSVFGALQQSAATAATPVASRAAATAQQAPAIMSLFA